MTNLIGRVDICSKLQQQLDHLFSILFASNMKRGKTILKKNGTTSFSLFLMSVLLDTTSTHYFSKANWIKVKHLIQITQSMLLALHSHCRGRRSMEELNQATKQSPVKIHGKVSIPWLLHLYQHHD